jgi:hypothetical protein
MADSVLIEWSPLIDTDGYIVSVCNPEEGGYKPLGRTTGSHLLVNGFEKPGIHYFQVRAYVEIDGSLVMNSGVIGKGEIELDMLPPEQPEEAATESTENEVQALQSVSELPDIAESGVPVKYTEARRTAGQLPGFTGTVSVYNPSYPEASNPFFETVKEDGTVIPPLLTNESIDRAVERLQKKREEQGLVTVDFTAVAAAPRPQSQQTVSGSQPTQPVAQPVKTAMVESSVPQEVKVQPAKNDAVQKPVTDLLKNVEEAKQNLAESKPEQLPPSTSIPSSPAEPESSGFGLILTIAIILGVVYFVVAKEAK